MHVVGIVVHSCFRYLGSPAERLCTQLTRQLLCNIILSIIARRLGFELVLHGTSKVLTAGSNGQVSCRNMIGSRTAQSFLASNTTTVTSENLTAYVTALPPFVGGFAIQVPSPDVDRQGLRSHDPESSQNRTRTRRQAHAKQVDECATLRDL